METAPTCPVCHTAVSATHYYCFNCGANLKPAPLSVSISKQISLYIKSILLPPMGIVWGMRYLRQPDPKSKLVGVIAITLTIITLVITIVAVKGVIDAVN